MTDRERLLGALILGGTADALGWRNEFWTPTSKRQRFVTRLEPWSKRVGRIGGYWAKVEAGDYSDDTQLTLAVARCMDPDGTYDPDRFARVELPYWLSYQRGGGRTVKRAAANLLANPSMSWDTNDFEGYDDAGANGAAMRVLALVIISDLDRLTVATWQNAIASHGHPRAIVGAITMAWGLSMLFNLRGRFDTGWYFQGLRERLREATLDLPNERLRRWIARKCASQAFQAGFDSARHEMLRFLDLVVSGLSKDNRDILQALGCLNPRTKGSGTATVAAGNFLFLKYQDNPERAAIEAANAYGADTDTIGKFAGNLLGALRGQAAYAAELTECLQDRLYFHRITDYLAGDRSERHWNGVRKTETTVTPQTKEGDLYYSKLLGFGEVERVSTPRRIERGRATLLEVRVVFECGQSCYFHRKLIAGEESQQNPLFDEGESGE